jgi:hypothetical protein
MTVTMNDCRYVAKLGNTKATPANTYGVTASLKCPAGKDVTVDIRTPGTAHAEGKAPMCVIHLGGKKTRTGRGRPEGHNTGWNR